MEIYIPNGNTVRHTVEKVAGLGEYTPNMFFHGVLRGSRSNPYLPRNDRLRCIFIHVPRTAGTSIATALFEGGDRGHIPLYCFRAFNKYKYDRYFKFAFFRNPFDRIVSSFHKVKYSATNSRTVVWSSKYLEEHDSFSSFIEKMAKNMTYRKVVMSMDHFRPQWEFISVNGKVDVDFLGKFSRLPKDIKKISERLGVSIDLDVRNETKKKRKKKLLQSSYKKMGKKIVQRRLQDI